MTDSICIIAGLDPSGGAGLLADARVLERFGYRAVGVATCLTEQDTLGVRALHPVGAELIAGQLRALLSDVTVAAVKIGLLGEDEIAAAVADALSLTAAPVVWDPVLAPSAGRVSLYRGDPGRAFAELAPHLALITPNADEATALVGHPVHTAEEAEGAARSLVARGVPAALVKGGHLNEAEAVDVLVEGEEVHVMRGARIGDGEAIHGTGCALSTAVACLLAKGAPMTAATREAKEWLSARIASPEAPGRGARSVL